MGQIYGINFGSPAADVSSTGRLYTNTQVNGVKIRGSGLVTFDKEHDRLIEGRLFNCGSYYYNVPADGSRSILINVGSIDVHMIFNTAIDGDTKMVFMENTHVTNSGTQNGVFNLYRCHTDTINTKIWTNPAVTTSGGVIHTAFIHGGSGTGTRFASINVGLGEVNTDWLLCNGSCYWIKFENICGRSSIINWNIKMHEH